MNSARESNSDTAISGGSVFDMPIRPGYVSCIKIDGKPILPPIMTEMKRAEMRHYRELAIGVENSLRYLRKYHQGQKNNHPANVPLNTTVTLEEESGEDDVLGGFGDGVDDASASFMKILHEIAAEDGMFEARSDPVMQRQSPAVAARSFNQVSSPKPGPASNATSLPVMQPAEPEVKITPERPSDANDLEKPASSKARKRQKIEKPGPSSVTVTTVQQPKLTVAASVQESASVLHTRKEDPRPEVEGQSNVKLGESAIISEPSHAPPVQANTTSSDKTSLNVTITAAIETAAVDNEEEEEEGISDVSNDGKDYFDDHFVVKKPTGENEWDMFENDGSCGSEYSSAESDLHSSVLPEVGSAESQPACPRVQDDDQKSEAMSLVSLDTEEEKIRQAIIKGNDEQADNDMNMDEDILQDAIDEVEVECITTIEQCSDGELSDFSVENYEPSSGRSSTETFIIERHNPVDVANNNDVSVSRIPRKNYFSPVHPTNDSSTIFGMDEAPQTVKAKKYFDSPPPVQRQQQHPSTEPVEVFKLADLPIIPANQVTAAFSLPTNLNTSTPFSKSFAATGNNCGASKKLLFDEEPVKDNSIHLLNPSVQCQTSDDVSEISSSVTVTTSEKQDTGALASNHIMNTTVTKPAPFTTSKVGSGNTDTKSETATKPSKIPLSPSKLNAMHQPQPKQNGRSSKRVSRRFDINQARNMQKASKNKNATLPAPVMIQSSAPASLVAKVGKPGVKIPDYSINQPLAGVNLSTLQLTMQTMSPSFFKAPSDARSPLLKGVMYVDPLMRPQRELRIPPEASNPANHPKFCKLTAAAKGFLVRRLLRTEKLQMIIQTIKDTVELVLKLYEEVPQLKFRGSPDVKPEDAELCRRLFQQLTGACQSFHDVFFKLTTQQRMAIIASDREKMKSKEMKAFLARTVPARLSYQPVRVSVKGGKQKLNRTSINSSLVSSKRKLSTATVKSLQRRMSTLHT